MAKEAAKTGSGPTALIAVEQYYPEKERIVRDSMAYRLLPLGMKAFVLAMRFGAVRDWMIRASEKDAPGIWGGMMCRKRYIDEKLVDSVGQIDAVVNLGAGFDTRAYRLRELSSVPVWEVDQPVNIRSKRARLIKAFGSIPSHVQLVETDFDREDLLTVLQSRGYSTDMRTFFIWEAVTQYLTGEGIRTTFDFLKNAAPGSRLTFTYVLKDLIEGRTMYGWERGYTDYVQKKIWIFGMDPKELPEFLKGYGWQLIEDVNYVTLAEKYIRPAGRSFASTPIERIVFAEKP